LFTATTFTQDATGTLELDITGLLQSEFGRVTVSGTANFDGDLSVNFSFAAADGDLFEVVTYASNVGQFTKPIIVNGLGKGLDLDAQYLATALQLDVVLSP